MGYTNIQRSHFSGWLNESDEWTKNFRITSVVVLDALMDLFIPLLREEES